MVKNAAGTTIPAERTARQSRDREVLTSIFRIGGYGVMVKI
jgi:hypothetical protein